MFLESIVFCTSQLENSTCQAKELLATTNPRILETQNNVSKNVTDLQLAVIPNPSKGIANLNYTLNKETTVSISVCNMQMQKVISDILLGKKGKGSYIQRIQLNNLSAGFYLIQLRTSEKTISTRLIITK